MRAAIVCVAVFALAACGDAGSGAGGEGGAYRACERAVETQLKSPSTADFSGAHGSTITKSGNQYSVAGTVDSQNGFGAMIRAPFACQLREVGDNWNLADISVG